MSDVYLGIDWGTTNRRAYLMSASGTCLRVLEDGGGMQAERGRFAQSLAELLQRLDLDPATPVIMSGMVGSAQGWQEVAYLDPGQPLTALARQLVPIQGEARRWIVPGFCQRAGSIDVMRGEETQLLGLQLREACDGWVILPGTHSKWVYLEGGYLGRWSTFMTGEWFSLFGQYGTLAALMAAGADDAASFADGLAMARKREPLSHALFTVRAAVVSQSLPAASARDLISGLLIGAEFCAMEDSDLPPGTLRLLGSPALTARYAEAAQAFGLQVASADAQACYLAALHQLYLEGVRYAV
ncbi:2-dehydro-3-deoxygalactonokinase [Massilia sp. TS11]|uniref:2-dehydro-3-deoxygalactonokinase n=1 Tax=Massilia sp. TS11 TaxID=2908003 RepID=UPI001EDA2903|nr:2-dehydro-3-deoxygalactonokinase [Massilia sp. TS11]MCG2586796.1 2-dehydro-3-deoxygalactonokinase [Massilia sp. TS11]